jgi:hypothetical protein
MRNGEHTEDNCGCGCHIIRLHDVLYYYDVDVEAKTQADPCESLIPDPDTMA